MSEEERQANQQQQAAIIRTTVESEGWNKIILPWLKRERKRCMGVVKSVPGSTQEMILKDYLLNLGPANFIERFLKMIDTVQGIKPKEEENE